jgi:hypothetical protein
MPADGAGTFPHRVTVQRRAVTNSGGVPVPGDPTVVYDHAPAGVANASAGRMQEVFSAQVMAVATHVVRMRPLAVRIHDELVWHDNEAGTDIDRVLVVEGKVQEERKRGITLAVREIVATS